MALCEYALDNAEHLERLWDESFYAESYGQTFQEHIQALKHVGTWGNHFVVVLLGHMLSVNVVVRCQNRNITFENYAGFTTIIVGYDNHGHYDAYVNQGLLNPDQVQQALDKSENLPAYALDIDVLIE